MSDGFALRIEPNQTVHILPTDDTDLDFLQKEVGGYITPVTFGFLPEENKPPFPISMYVDEDGLSKRLPENRLASLLGMTPLVGNAVIVRQAGADDTPLNEIDMNTVIQWIMAMTNPTSVKEVGADSE